MEEAVKKTSDRWYRRRRNLNLVRDEAALRTELCVAVRELLLPFRLSFSFCRSSTGVVLRERRSKSKASDGWCRRNLNLVRVGRGRP